MSVSVNPPKTPLTKGSIGTAVATLPNVCKMPGPPAPFVPTPLPNIGRTRNSPKGYSKKVKIKGKTVAVKGASFGSRGDIASKGTGGGVVSSNTHGPCKFISPGSMDVKIEGKNVHLLCDMVTNNGGPSGSPPNSATMMGTVNEAGVVYVPKDVKCPICKDQPKPHGDFEETPLLTGLDSKRLIDDLKAKGNSKSTMIGVVHCQKGHRFASSSKHLPDFIEIAKADYHVYRGIKREDAVKKMKEEVKKLLKGSKAFDKVFEKADLDYEKKRDENISRNIPGACAAQKALVLALEHNCTPSAMTEKWCSSPNGKETAPVRHINLAGELIPKSFKHLESVPPCETCNQLLPFLTCAKPKEDSCEDTVAGCANAKCGGS